MLNKRRCSRDRNILEIEIEIGSIVSGAMGLNTFCRSLIFFKYFVYPLKYLLTMVGKRKETRKEKRLKSILETKDSYSFMLSTIPLAHKSQYRHLLCSKRNKKKIIQ